MEKVGNHLREKILIVDDVRLHRDRTAEILARRMSVTDLATVFPGYACDPGRRPGAVA